MLYVERQHRQRNAKADHDDEQTGEKDEQAFTYHVAGLIG